MGGSERKRPLALAKVVEVRGHLLVACLNGGEIGIRTLGTASGSTDFESAAFDHSAISP
jgi:hypothetical protein